MILPSWFLLSFLVIILTLVVGYSLSFLPSIRWGRFFAWAVAILSVSSLYFLTGSEAEPFTIMLLLIFGLLFSIKAIVHVESVHTGKGRLSPGTYLTFAIAWLGMRPYIFHTLGQQSVEGWKNYLWQGFRNCLIGILFLLGGRELFTYSSVLSSILLLCGLSLILHFGLIPLQAACWRLFGVHAPLLFKEPYKAKSLSEFWSQRWNLAFSEMTSIAIFRPLKPILGPAAALWICFLISGIFHELAISVPVNKGFVMPTLFFILQALGITLEQHKFFKNFQDWTKRVWTFCWLILPAPILFHPYFVKEIVWETILK